LPLADLRNMRNNLRIMRKTATLEALFPKTRQAILAATLTQPEKWWFLSELARFLGTTPSSLQREISALVDTGILEQRREGTRVYFRAQKRSPIYRELRGIVEKTAGIIPIIQTILAPLGRKIICAFIYGSIARPQEHATSDIDLMVIGQVGLSELTPALRKAERALGRDLNATTYSVDEFRGKVEKNDHFLTALLKRPKQFVKGTERELDAIIGK
jgi:DNA-binding transcriptional ArsR family regulator